MTAQAYPLQWPEHMPRSHKREKSKFRTSLAGALNNVRGSLQAFANDSGKNITGIVLSSNVTLGIQTPSDPGVAAWFVWDGLSVCIPCDRYLKPEENLQAIHHVIEARRVELRHGTLHMVRATLSGFKALPPPPGSKPKRPWWEVLEIQTPSAATGALVDERFRQLSKKRHPDAGGSHDAMAELMTARKEALEALRT